MARIKIELPKSFSFTTTIPVRITDVNYGNHVGNDSLLGLIHEARMQYLASFDFTEMKFAGAGLIMSDVGVEFKSELFYGDVVLASVAITEFSRVGFDVFYKLEKEIAGKTVLVAAAKTGMVCVDYATRKIVGVPEEAKKKIGNAVASEEG